MREYLEKSLEYIKCKSVCFESSTPGTCTCGAEELINNIKKELESSQIVFAGASTVLTDSADLTFDSKPLQINNKSVTTMSSSMASAIAKAVDSKHNLININMLPPVQLADCNSTIGIDWGNTEVPDRWVYLLNFCKSKNYEFKNRDYLKPIYSEWSIAFTNKPTDPNALVTAIKAPDKK